MNKKKKISERVIINTFFRSTRGIKGTAGYLGLSKSYVGKIITQYKKKYNLR